MPTKCKVEDCCKDSRARGWCSAHYQRWTKYGNPRTFVGKGNYRDSPEKRFWDNTFKTKSCWLWQGYTNAAGYGVFKVQGKSTLAHRFSYSIHNDAPDDFANTFVCHSCDNPPCVNPQHLFLGNNQDNISDCAMKFRHHKQVLSFDDIASIKARINSGEVQRRLAEEFNVSPATINRIAKGIRYGYIQPG